MTPAVIGEPPPGLRARPKMNHSPATMNAARAMHEAGWTPTEIARYFAQQGNPVPMTTVRSWVLPPKRSDAYREQMAAHARKIRAAQRQSAAPEHRAPTDDPLAQALRLRIGDDLSYHALTVVLREYHGVTMSAERLRYHLTRMGAPRNPNKARATTREQTAGRS